MGVFNWFGLIIFVFLMIPNIIYFRSLGENGDFSFKNRKMEILENIGRYGSFITLIFNIPYTWFGFFFPYGETIYYVVDSMLLLIYILTWVIMWKRDTLTRALILSITPSILLVFSGVMISSILLMIFSVLFTVCHIRISVDKFLK